MNKESKLNLVESEYVTQVLGGVYKNFLKEIFNREANNSPMPLLNEVTVNRLLGKHYDSAFVIVSASRPENTAQENNQLTKELLLKLKNNPYSYIPIFGQFITNKGSVNEQLFYETSFLILNFNKDKEELPFEGLKTLGLEICSEFSQTTILVKSPDGNPKTLTRNGEVDIEFSGSLVINDLTQAYLKSLIKARDIPKTNQSSFTLQRVYINPPPATYSERHIRYLSGEIFLSRN